jgi:hypothetical protein
MKRLRVTDLYSRGSRDKAEEQYGVAGRSAKQETSRPQVMELVTYW